MIKNRRIRLPTYLVDTPAWGDYAEVVEQVFDEYVDQPLAQHGDALNVTAYHPMQVKLKAGKSFLSFSDYTYEGVRWVSKSNRIRAASMIGYAFTDISKLGDGTIELLVNSGAQFLPNQGKPEFVNFLNYVLNATVDVQNLWCNEWRKYAQLSTYTADFANAAWTKTNVTVTSGVSYGPYGVTRNGMDVDRIYETTATGAHGIGRTYTGLTVATNYTVSRHVKKGSRDWAYLELDNGTTTARVWLNIPTLTLGTNTGVQNVHIMSLGLGWVRISGSLPTTAAGTTLSVFVGSATADNQTSYTGNASNSTYMFGEQFELGISATEYTRMVAALSNTVTETTYGTFVPEGSASIGVPVYQSGSWFPTTHVDVAITVDPSRNVSLDLFRTFFQFVAPINIVIRNIVYSSNFVFDPLSVSGALQLQVFQVTEAAPPKDTRSKLYMSGALQLQVLQLTEQHLPPPVDPLAHIYVMGALRMNVFQAIR